MVWNMPIYRHGYKSSFTYLYMCECDKMSSFRSLLLYYLKKKYMIGIDFCNGFWTYTHNKESVLFNTDGVTNEVILTDVAYMINVSISKDIAYLFAIWK